MAENSRPLPASAASDKGSGIYIGTFLDIRFYLDFSWFFIAAMLTWVLASGYFPSAAPGLSGPQYAAIGFVTALLFFLSILLHELGHSVVSQRCGIPVPRITLLFIGGVAEIAREPEDAKSELKIALGGPAVSLVLGFLFLGASSLFRGGELGLLAAMTWWLGLVNFTLLIFNLFPGYPLDGGRVLRALIWWKTGNARKATFWASRMGVGFSWFLIVLGLFRLLPPSDIFNAMLLIFIGLFLKSAAESGYQHAVQKDVLDRVFVRDVMTPHPICIPASLPLNLAVDDFFLRHHHVGFPVVDADETLVGVARLEHLRLVERPKWPYRTASDLVAEAETGDRRTSPDTPASELLRQMMIPGYGRLAVVDAQSRVIGFITRHDLMQSIRVRDELSETR